MILERHDTAHVDAPSRRLYTEDEIQRLREVLCEAMQQAVEYDGLDVTKIGPQHWYMKASEVLK